MPTVCFIFETCRLQRRFPMHYWNEPDVIDRFITEYPQYKSQIKIQNQQKEKKYEL